MMAQVAHVFPGMVYAPQLWRTGDGAMPYRVLVAWYQMIPSALALTRMSLAGAVRLGMGGPGAEDVERLTAEQLEPE